MVCVDANGVVDPLEPELWQLIKQAIPALQVIVADRVANGTFLLTQQVPQLAHFDSGWPRVERPFGGTDGAFRYSDLFTPDGRQNTTAYTDVPELAAVMDFLLDRSDLADRLRVIPDNDSYPKRAQELMLQLAAARFPLSILDRVYALGAPQDPDLLRRSYLELEHGMFGATWTADIIAPLIMTDLEIEASLDLGGGVSIERLGEDLICAGARDEHMLEAVTTMASNAATHAVVVANVELAGPSSPAPEWGSGPNPGVDLTRVDTAVEALRVVANVPTGYAHIYLRPHGWATSWLHDLPPAVAVGTYRRYPSFFDNFGWLRPRRRVSAETLAALPQIHAAMATADPAVRLAVRRLSMASLRENEDNELLDACIGIEALLSDDASEITHKIATRGAAALAAFRDPPLRPEIVFDAFKKVYTRRSALVHGTGSNKHLTFQPPGGKQMSTVRLAALLLRTLLLSKLASETSWTIKSLDAMMLAAYMPAEPEPDAESEAEPVAPVSE